MRDVKQSGYWFLGPLLGLAIFGMGLRTAMPVRAEQATQTAPTAFEPPPGQGAPETTTAGGKRIKPFCPGDRVASDIPLIPLTPASHFGLTTASHPTVFVYVPATSAQTAEFQIFNTNNETIYRDAIALPSRSQLLRIALPPTAQALEPDRDYRWSFTLICDPSDRQRDRVVAAWIHRIQLNPDQSARLDAVSPEQRALIYAQSGIWYDALDRLTQRRSGQSLELQAAWQKLLQSAGLGFLAEEQPQAISK